MGAGLDTEAVQDVVGAMVTGAGGTYDDAAGTITLPTGGGSTSAQIGTLTLPGSPTAGACVLLLANSSTTFPGGITWDLLISSLMLFRGKRLVGMDCLELAPHYDPTGVSAITMAKTLREMILLADQRRR